MIRRVLPLATLVLLSALAAPADAAHGGTIRVLGDADLVGPHWTGSGTPADPFRLVPTALTPRDGYAIDIANTRLHVNLTGLVITGGGGQSDAIRLHNVRNLTVWGSTLETNRYGIHVRDSEGVVLGANVVKTSSVGVYLENSRGVVVRDNRISLNDRDIQFRVSHGNTLRNNNLSTATGQFGLFFEDNASYSNSIDPTNVVNAVPVRWYADLANTTISDVTADLAGMTNVAQVMVYNATNVRLERAVAKSGAAGGIVVTRSANVTLEAPVADANGGNGIVAEMSSGVRIFNGSARTNIQSGILLRSAYGADVERTTLTANREGLSLTSTSDAVRLRNLTLSANGGRGVVAASSSNVTLEDSSLLGDALILEDARDARAARNTFSGPSPSGISLVRSRGLFHDNVIRDRTTAVGIAASTGSNFSGNAVTLPVGGTGFAFDGLASYANGISTTNLVNGTPVRWYTDVVGPVDLEGVVVETRGITNVAQIMLYRVANVTLHGPVASNGTGAGILVHTSSGVNASAVRASFNTREGILVQHSSQVRIPAATLGSNGGDGVRIEDTQQAIVENTVVNASGGRGIAVERGALATLRGNAVHSNHGVGIHVVDAGPGAAAIDLNVVEKNAGGIHVARSALGSVRANVVRSNGADGIAVSSVPAGARIDDNVVSDHTRGIRLGAASGTGLAGNVLTIATGQWGVHFDDEASYDVALATSNVVNAVPVRWYVGTANTTIGGIGVELQGITNVAQVMLHRVANVTLDNATATNGTARGVYVHLSENVTLQRSRSSDHAQAGVVVQGSKDVRLNDTVSTRNTQEGFRLDAPVRATLENLSALANKGRGAWIDAGAEVRIFRGLYEDNGGAGASITRSGGVRVENATFRRDKGGLDVSASEVRTIANNTVFGNGDSGVSLAGGSASLVEANRVEDHAKGFVLASISQAVFLANEVTMGAGGTAWHFSDPAAYDNSIGPTNTANGVPMRWYAGLRNATIEGIRANVAGMTNVAQVGLHRVHNVTLVDARVEGSRGHGILVTGGQDVSILASRAVSNAGEGIRLDGTVSATVRNTTVTSNQIGLTAVSSVSVLLDNLTASDNRGNGVDDVSGSDMRILSSLVERNQGHGVLVRLATEANVSRLVLRGNGGDGLHVSEASFVKLYDNDVRDAAGAGIRVHKLSPGARIEGNRVENASQGLRIAGTEFVEVHANAFLTRSGQTGIHFDDETSYNSAIPTTNTVNGAPIHWYTALAGSESEPIVLPALRAEVPGMTNVAQVMLYRSAYVSAPDLVATNGTRGVYLYRSSAITLDRADLSNNSLAGGELHAAQSSTLRDVRAQGSGAGVRLSASLSNVVTRVNATGATVGVHILGDSRDNRVEQIETNGSARGIRDDGWNGADLPGNNLLADAGSPKRVRTGAPASFADPTVSFRHESSRIVEQRWSWGDGTPDTVATSGLLKPAHAYATPGRYRVDLTVTTSGGDTLRDALWVDAVPPLSVPLELVAWPGNANATLAWAPPASDGASPVTGYRIYRGAHVTELAVLTTTGPTTRYVDNKLENGRVYVYGVAAVNADGEGPRATTAVVPVSPPGAPRSLRANATPNAVDLAWEMPSELNGLSLSGYVVLRSSNGSALAPLAAIGNVTTFRDAGLANGVAYTYAVRATNALGSGLASANATATPIGPPTPPRSLRALPGDASVVLLWEPPADAGGTPVTSYRVWRAIGSGPPSLLPVALAGNASSWRDTGLSNGLSYVYGVAAVNAYGEGERSASANATPVAVDSLAPVVYGHEPAPGALLRRSPASVGARFVDNGGVPSEHVRLYLDGLQVGAEVDEAAARYTLPGDLPAGEHVVRLVARDAAGNEADETWRFRILAEEDLVARFEESEHALVPERALPGENVTARLVVRNVGYADGTAVVRVLEGGRSLGLGTVSLAPEESGELVIVFQAPSEGVHEIRVGEATLRLAVGDVELDAPVVPEPGLDPPTPVEAETPRRPVRSVPPPRAPEDTRDTPLPAGALLLVALAASAMRRRRA